MSDKINILGYEFTVEKDSKFIKTLPVIKVLKLLSDCIFKLKVKSLQKSYVIVPLGEYCMPRVITTISGLKKRKIKGEKSFPFDLAFFRNFDKVLELLSTKFVNFYDCLDFNKEWFNPSIDAIFNHDGNLTKEEFIKRYDNRIKNLYDCFADKNMHKFILIASFKPIDDLQIKKLIRILKMFMPLDMFDIILVNQSPKFNNLKMKNLFVINQNHNCENFDRININGDWVTELRMRKMLEALLIYNEITSNLISFIKNKIEK